MVSRCGTSCTLPNISLELRLVEADFRVDQPDGVKNACDAEGRELAGQHRLLPGGRHEALRGQVIDLGRLVLLQDVDQRHLVQQVALDEGDLVLEVADTIEIDRAGAAHHAQHLVSLG